MTTLFLACLSVVSAAAVAATEEEEVEDVRRDDIASVVLGRFLLTTDLD